MLHRAMDPPTLTADLPGVGGRIKVQASDFVVEEIPSYEPSGVGDHLYLWVEKINIGPEFLTRMIADRLGTHVGNLGTAGLKDRYAITRQWVSVPKECEPNLKKIDGDGLRVLNVSRHVNKLKPGHLRGNSFRILIRDADRSQRDAFSQVIERIRAHGMPNYYGPQRFGREGSTLDLGFKCLSRTMKKRIRPFQFRFALSAVQSLLFNEYLALRLVDGLLRTVQEGDVMMKWPGGGIFVAEDVAAEQARFDARETVTGGPMYGSRMYAAKGPAAEREARILSDHDLSSASFDGFGKMLSGTRRHNLVYLNDLTADWEPEGLRLSFMLPAGCYATVLLKEVMKTVPAEEEPPAEDDDE